MTKVDENEDKKIEMANQDKTKLDKYLTDIKELPPTSREEMEPKLPKKEEVVLPKKKIDKPPDSKSATEKARPIKNETVVKEDTKETDKTFEDEESKKSKLPLSSKDVILGVINLITITLLVILLLKLPEKSSELQGLRIEEARSQTSPLVKLTDIEEDKKKAEELEMLFLDESGVVDFVNEVEKLKVEEGAIQKVTFASQKAVKDRVGNYGVPVIIEMRGTWQKIGSDLEKIQTLPFIFRPASIKVQRSIDDPSVLEFKYGVFLYVNDELGENR